MSIVDRLREGAAALPAVRLAVVFGSTARGKQRPRSDVDVDVLLEPGLWTHFKARAMVDWWDWAPTARKIHRAAMQRLRGEPVTWEDPVW